MGTSTELAVIEEEYSHPEITECPECHCEDIVISLVSICSFNIKDGYLFANDNNDLPTVCKEAGILCRLCGYEFDLGKKDDQHPIWSKIETAIVQMEDYTLQDVED